MFIAGLSGAPLFALCCLTGRIWPAILSHYLIDFTIYSERYARELRLVG